MSKPARLARRDPIPWQLVVPLVVGLLVFPATAVQGHEVKSMETELYQDIDATGTGIWPIPDPVTRRVGIMTSRDAGSCWGTADGWCRLGGSLLEFSDLTGKDDPIHLSLETTTDENKMVLICTDADTDGTYCETDGDGGPVEFVRRFCLKNHDWWDYWDDGQVHLPRHKQVAIFVGFPVAEGVGTAPVSCGSGAQSDEASLRVMTPELPIRPIEGVAWTEGNGYVGREVNDTLEDRRSKACNENGLTAGERCDVWTIVQDLWSCGYPLEELPEDARKLVEQLLGEAPEIVQNVVDEARDQAHDAKCKARDTVEEVT